MGLRIHSNVPSLFVQRQLKKTGQELESSLKQMASGQRFVTAGEAPADFTRAEKLRTAIAGYQAGQRNAQVAKSLSEVAEATFSEQSNILIRLKEVAVQAASETLDEDSRSLLQMEAEQLTAEVDRLALSTSYGSHRLLTGKQQTYQFQVGPENHDHDQIQTEVGFDARAKALDINNISFETAEDAQEALEVVDTAINAIASGRAGFGALHTRLESAAQHNESMAIHLTEAKSQLADADLAAVTTDYARHRVQQHYQIQALNKTNQSTAFALKLVA